MGTVFDIGVYHPSRADAERAVDAALDEIVRLDRVLSNFKSDSDLSRLVRDGRAGFVRVEPSLYAVIESSIAVSQRSHGAFDITIAPLVRVWKQAREEGRLPAESEISAARRCVGYERIELSAPDRIRLLSDCVELDLGAIGKGYAVGRAIDVLVSAGIRHAIVDAGRSSIAAIGKSPGLTGWKVGLPNTELRLMLRGESISTSQAQGEIVDPRSGVPAVSAMTISVVAPSATLSDALSTTLMLLSVDDAKRLLRRYAEVSAFWISSDGALKDEYRARFVRSTASR